MVEVREVQGGKRTVESVLGRKKGRSELLYPGATTRIIGDAKLVEVHMVLLSFNAFIRLCII